MRIQAQHETFAAFRRTAFDWREEHYDEDPGGSQGFHAPLENGHNLSVNTSDGVRWQGGYYHKPTGHTYTTGKPVLQYQPVRPLGPDGKPEPFGVGHGFPDAASARSAVEQSYQQAYPVGTNTGPHDSGTDYSDLNSFTL